MASVFVAVIVILVAYILARILLGKPDLEPLAAPWDPLGSFMVSVATRYWTASDRNTLLPPLTGALLFNRLFVTTLGFAALAAAWPLFQVGERPAKAARAAPPEAAVPAPAALAPRVAPRFDRASLFAQLVERTHFDMHLAFRSPVLWVILGLALFNASAGLWFSTDDGRYGAATWPVTRVMIVGLRGSFTFFVTIIAAYFAGELVWRDRDRRIHEIVDATPAPDWTFLVPKTLAVILILGAVLLAGILAGVIVQTLKGYYDYRPDEYLLWYFLPGIVDLSIIAALAVFGQTIAPNKFAGWGVMVLWIIVTIVLPANGFEHNLYIFGGTPPEPLSDMNGQGRFWIGAWWFRLYWGACSLLLLTLGYAIWRRGVAAGLMTRLRVAPQRLRGLALGVGLLAAIVFVGSGVFIWRNTNVLNEYRTDLGDDRWQADYEKTLLPYEKTPQPTITAMKLDVSIAPDEPSLETRGVYVLKNLTAAPLREVHVRFSRDLEVRGLSVQGAWPKKTYDRFNYRIFAFDTPMAPGETRTLSFNTRLFEHGFRNGQTRTRDLYRVVDNGVFVNSEEIAPIIGMSRDLLLTDRAKRRKYGLPVALHLPPPGDAASRARNYAQVGWATSDITITTPADQVPLAPGYEVSDVVHGGLRTARFVTDQPILGFFSIQSARYAIKRETYKGVTFAVYYDPQHPANVDRMLRALTTSLDYYQANFSPYQFHEVRVSEFPDYAQFAQSFAGTFPWSEGLGFIADYRDPTRVDLVTYVAAHEFAHQWWAHQIIGADQQGVTVLSETLAQYSALRVMRRMYGPAHIRKFLKYELDSYLRARGGEVAEEEPLERVEPDQGYIHYRKGSLVMYRLAEEIGEDKVNQALRTLLAKYAFKGAPYPTSLDLVAALRAVTPPDKQQLITDLFEKITIYDMKATDATWKKRADGKYEVSFTVQGRKYYADGKGRQTEAPLAEPFELGVFSAQPGKKGFSAASVLAFERRPVVTGTQRVTFVVDGEPKWVGVDPYNKRIDRDSEDNLTAVGAGG
jgi:aminopeptidase N